MKHSVVDGDIMEELWIMICDYYLYEAFMCEISEADRRW